MGIALRLEFSPCRQSRETPKNLAEKYLRTMGWETLYILVYIEPHLDPAALGAHVEVAGEAVEAVAAVVPDVGAPRVAENMGFTFR